MDSISGLVISMVTRELPFPTPHAPWQCLYFLPLPQGHFSLRPTFLPATTCLGVLVPSPPTNCSSAISFSFLRWTLRVKSCMVLWAARRLCSLGSGRGASSCCSRSEEH